MVKYENNCVDCERCVFCGNKHQKVITCDVCGEQFDPDDRIFQIDDKELCTECFADRMFSEFGVNWEDLD